MKKNDLVVIGISCIGIILLFFHSVILKGYAPHPSDTLVSEFQPWRSASYEGYAPGGIPNKAQYPDTLRQMYPWKTQVVQAFREGRLPLWNPYSFSGSPLLANFQSAALYPLGILYLTLPQIDAWTVLVILQPLLAILFTYWYARVIGLGTLPAILSAVSFGFSGFMAVWLEYNTVGHVILWLPLMLLSIERLRDKPSARWTLALTLSNTFALLAGHPQVYAYSLAFSLVYAWFRMKRNTFPYALLCSVLGIGIGGIQLVPGLELIRVAARSPHDPSSLFSNILIQPWQLLALPFPNIFGNPATRTYFPSDTFVGKVTTIGLVPLFFILSAFRRKDTRTRFFIMATGTTLLLITANPVTYFLYRIPIPVITSSSPTLMAYLFSFSLAILSGLGLEYWMTDKHSVRKLILRSVEVYAVLAMLLLLTRMSAFPLFAQHTSVITKALIYAGAVSAAVIGAFWVAITKPKYLTGAVVLLILVHVFDLYVFFNRFNPFVPKSLVFPEHPVLTFLRTKSPDRYWGYATAGISANFSAQYGIFSPEGYDPLYPKWYGQYLYSYRTGSPLKQFDNATRSDAAIRSSFGDGGLSDTKKQAVLNALSVRYILDRTENASNETTFPPDVFKKAFTYNEWTIYENANAKPRAWMTEGTASIIRYEPEQVIIKTQNSSPGTLTLTDTYYPGWIADVDGAGVPIEKTDEGLRRIRVPAGAHTVTFAYKPSSFALGVALSLVSLGATIIGILILTRKRP